MKKRKRGAVSWEKVKIYYVTSEARPSLRQVAEKFRLNKRQVERRSAAEKWPAERKKHVGKTSEKCRRKIEKRQALTIENEIAEIQKLEEGAIVRLQLVEAKSFESLLRAIIDAKRYKASLLGWPTERIEITTADREKWNVVFDELEKKCPEIYEKFAEVCGVKSEEDTDN